MDTQAPSKEIAGQVTDDRVFETKWPKVLGIISLIYAILGICCASGYALSLVFMDALMAMGGMEAPDLPPVVAIGGYVMILLWLGLGVLMMAGAISLMRRRPSGPSLLKVWALLRVLLIFVGVAWAVVTAPAQIDFQRAIWEAQDERMRESGSSQNVPPPTDEAIWRQIMLNTGIISGLIAIYPTFIIFYLSRRSIANEVSEWR